MRIQETDRILKEARVARTGAPHEPEEGRLARVWHKLTGLFKKH